MATHDYGLLDQADEDAHQKARLLTVETRPFVRVARRLLERNSHIYAPPTAYPSPPPEASAVDEEAAAREANIAQQAKERQIWREELHSDFSALEDSLVRVQLLRRSNERECERYAAERIKILDTQQTVRADTVELRVRLDEARRALALRKEYDTLAERITSNRMLKPREDQAAALDKLNQEIAELEAESRAYAQTWAERRAQFQRIVEEGRQMLRMIRDEKEEAERKEGMEEASEGDGSRAPTPLPDTGGQTPANAGQEGETGGEGSLQASSKDMLAPVASSGRNSRASSPGRASNAGAASASQGGSRVGTPGPAEDVHMSPIEEGEDTDMGEAGEIEDTPVGEPELTADVEVGVPDSGQLEEGEEPDGGLEDKMET